MPAQDPLQGIIAEVHALDSKVRVIAQRMKIIEKNEQIIGKTLISHNKALKELEKEISGLKGGVSVAAPVEREPSEVPGDYNELKLLINDFKDSLSEIQIVRGE